MKSSVNIIWAAPKTLSCDGIVALLDQETKITIVYTVSMLDEILPTLLSRPNTNLLVIDQSLLKDHCTYLATIRDIAPDIKTLVLSGTQYDGDILCLMKSGADGYITNQATRDEFLFAVEHILANNTYISPALHQKMLESVAASDFDISAGKAMELSTREAQFLKLILEGVSDQEIAYQLFTNKRGVMKYRDSLLKKTGAADIGTAIRIALQQGALN